MSKKSLIAVLKEKRERAYSAADYFKVGSPEYRSHMSEASTLTEVITIIEKPQLLKYLKENML